MGSATVHDVNGACKAPHGSQTISEDPIAIIGLGLKFPQDAVSAESFWEMLVEGRSARSEVPKERYNVDAFYAPGESKTGTVNVKAGHFIKDDLAGFDAPFFSMNPGEVASMDPLQRWLLETCYQALENSGLKVHQVNGSNTSVFIGSFIDEYGIVLNRDTQMPQKYKAPGTAVSMLANRLSWFYDLRGPSVSIDTACSSSLVAFHLACQSLRLGESEMSIIGGCNLIYNPESFICLSDLGFLSPDGISYSFDKRANGYARGEGFGIVIIKPLSKAIRDGNTIRAVVRATGSNQDGRTPGITQPSMKAQETMVRETYHAAGLDMGKTAFVEAHATGTPLGDPIEAAALGNAFKDSRLTIPYLHLGAVKSNIGHLEGASGVAGLIKTVLALEKAIIPPNVWFKELNPRIHAEKLKVKFPIEPIPWPTNGLRRASVNSFGFGGANAHVVMDDAFNYLKDHHLVGKHMSAFIPPTSHSISTKSRFIDQKDSLDEILEPSTSKKLFVFSASDAQGLKRLTEAYGSHLKLHHNRQYLDDLAYTLSEKRNQFPWRCFTVASSTKELKQSLEIAQDSIRSCQSPNLCYVFTGQGAQWHAMGRELLGFSAFRESIDISETIFRELGCTWSLVEELSKDKSTTMINDASYSQPICTALQIALVQQLLAWSIKPSVVVGHSSGEIAAAYCTGALSHSSACKVAYFRGYVADSLLKSTSPGAMLAVGLSEHDILPFLNQAKFDIGTVTVACLNGPKNITLSGCVTSIGAVQSILEQHDVFVRRLPGQVAYHSPYMNSVAELYKTLISDLFPGTPISTTIMMFSSLSGSRVSNKETSNANYWVENMTSPVKFSQAIGNLSSSHLKKLHKSLNAGKMGVSVDQFLEIGPHSTLKSVIRETVVSNNNARPFKYASVLVRGKSAIDTAAEAVGRLWCEGHPVDIGMFNDSKGTLQNRNMLIDLPGYPFDHSRKFWIESRLSKGYRFRQYPHQQVLGTRVADWNPLEARWRNLINLTENSWIKDHNVNGADIYPAAGMLVMAMEAGQQLSDRKANIKGYHFKDVSIKKALVIPGTEIGVEVQLYFRPGMERIDGFLAWSSFRICVYENMEWSDICDGMIAIEYDGSTTSFLGKPGRHRAMLEYQSNCQQSTQRCTQSIQPRIFYSMLKDYGLKFGKSFQSLTDLRYSEDGDSMGTTNLRHLSSKFGHNDIRSDIIHPASLDAFLQLTCLALNKGGKETLPTMVPTSFRNLWISAEVGNLNAASSDKSDNLANASITIHTKSKLQGFREAHSKIIAENMQSGAIVLTGEFNVMAIAEFAALGTAQTENSRKLCYNLEWKPDFDYATVDNIYKYCSGNTPYSSPYANLDHEKSLLCHLALKQLTAEAQNIGDQQLKEKPHLRRYLEWAKYRLEVHVPKMFSCDKLLLENNKELATRVATSDPQGNLLASVAKNLRRIMKGETDALEVIFNEGLVNEYYQFISKVTSAFNEAANYIDVLAHKLPNMNILEIGAGTGSATAKIIRTLTNGSSEEEIASKLATHRFHEYTFTDISTSFFEAAKGRFSDCADKMSYKILDIERNPTDQGFNLGQYDLIIASNVLHATTSLKATLDNVKSLLKPGGKLFLFEITASDTLTEGFVFGLLPGWWLSTEEERKWGPTVTRASWDSLLRSSGFSGLDLAFPPGENPGKCSTMISTAVQSSATPNNFPKAVILASKQSSVQLGMAKHLQLLLNESFPTCDIFSIDEIKSIEGKQTVCISLLDIEDSYLHQICKREFEALKYIFSSFETIVWASSRVSTTANPLNDATTGLARCLREENSATKFVTVKLQQVQDLGQASGNLFKVTQKTLQLSLNDYEPEFMEIDGSLCINRISELNGLNDFVARQTTPQSAQLQKFRDGELRPMKLTMGHPGLLSSFQYQFMDPRCMTPLGEDEVEVEVKASGVNFRDVLIALGQDPASYLGLECSGVITRAGNNAAAKFKPMDRVCCILEGSLQNIVRVDAQVVIHIPDAMSFPSAAAFPVAYSSAYYSVIDVGRLKERESILIHSGAGAFGQACIQLAKLQDAEIFTTVGTDEKREFLIEAYGIKEQNIFSSRGPDFVQGIKTLTNGRGVDVIINSLAGEALKCSWECIAPFGRFVEVGKKDIYNFGSLPMFPFSRNATFSSVDVFYIYLHSRAILKGLMESSMALFMGGKITVPSPIQVYSGSEVEQAFRYLESGKSKGKIVVEFHDNDVVPVVPSHNLTYDFDPNATYVIAGGLGGIGRSIARWMVARSARNLILLSRSTVHSDASVTLIKELQQKGICVATPPCDIGDSDSLKDALKECRNMPPIKGCVQAAMVLKDSKFANMTIEEFQGATRCKIDGSWNLHSLLPSGMDFFILLSSFAGVIGSHGQSNYAAGNTYQDALAHYRISQGEKALSLDLGMISRVGYMAEREGLEDLRGLNSISEVQENELHAMLEYACDPKLPVIPDVACQVVTGIDTPAVLKSRGAEEPYWMLRPLFSPLYHVTNKQISPSQEYSNGVESCRDLIEAAETLEEVSEVILNGLQTKLSRTLAVEREQIDTTKPMHTYGVDSLSAVELRTWFRNVVGVNITVFDILNNQSLVELATTVAPRSHFLAKELQDIQERQS